MTDRHVHITKTFEVTFNDEDGFEDATNEQLEAIALEGMHSMLRTESEYTDCTKREYCNAVIVADADMDSQILRNMIGYKLVKDLRKRVEAIDEDENYELTCDEFDLHDWITSLNHTTNMCRDLVGPDGETHFNQIKLQLDELDDETEEPMLNEAARLELEDAFNKLISHINNVDALLHDIAEYTC